MEKIQCRFPAQDQFVKFERIFDSVLKIARNNVEDWASLVECMKSVSDDFNSYSQNEEYKKIMIHTLRVIHCLQKDANFILLCERERQILLWTGLFHDCAKNAPPHLYSKDGRDPAHPFRSCFKTLIHLNKLKVHVNTDKQMELWKRIFENAYHTEKEGQEQGLISNNMEILPKIMLFLERNVSPFFRIVLKLICLHQCIPCTQYPPYSPINLKDTSLYFEKRELQLLEIFWSNDSYSYVCNLPRTEFSFGQEIHQSIQTAIQYL